MKTGDLRRLLLGLLGPQDAERPSQLSHSDWKLVDAMAAQHRLQPHLHGRLGRGEIGIEVPTRIAGGWRDAHRDSALRALAMRRTLFEISALLEAHGVAAVALKGAWCAWHLYPAAAERPMRDLDLLVASGQALQAFELLRENGFHQEEPGPRSPEQSLQHDKHLPPLLSPGDVRVELHMRLWERHEAVGWAMPADESAVMFASARPYGSEDPVHYLAAEDMLVHFVIHGAYSNRLDGGPLVLADIDYLAQQGGIDWDSFWTRAERGNFTRGAALLFHLVERWRSPGVLALSRCPVEVDSDLLERAPDLLLQDLRQRKGIHLAAGIAGGVHRQGWTSAIQNVTRRLRGGDRPTHAPDEHDESGAGRGEGFARWLVRRLLETVLGFARTDVRQAASSSARLGTWLEGEE
ncbi:nucleotidyltransferase domain-containing protein [Qipengyuania sp. CAU 1752]